jgi:DNA (cytosine-5)-methyltransferase 1
MKYGSVCSGIEAATSAWHQLGWKPSFFSEIDEFPRAVLSHHYPAVPLHGDFTTIEANQYEPIRLLVGGTPCQSFSVAGLRAGLDDERGNLSLEFIRLAQRLAPDWIVWENVPGVLSSNGGRDFGAFLGALAHIGYGFAYRVLDAQYFGVAQRRRRVFVIGYRGDWRRAAAVLFEPESLCRDTAPSREKAKDIASTVVAGPPFSRTGNERVECDALVVGALDTECGLTKQTHQSLKNGHYVTARMRGFGDYECDGTASALKARDWKDATHLVAFNSQNKGSHWDSPDNPHPTLNQSSRNSGGIGASNQEVFSQRGGGIVQQSMAVRRLTPTECERLQGFPDGFTNVPYRGKADAPDTQRYKAIGNSMAVPVMRWIGERIQLVDKI